MTTRRSFLKQSSALALIPLMPVASFEIAAANKVPLDDPAAKALRYVEDATLAKRADKWELQRLIRFVVTVDFT